MNDVIAISNENKIFISISTIDRSLYVHEVSFLFKNRRFHFMYKIYVNIYRKFFNRESMYNVYYSPQ